MKTIALRDIHGTRKTGRGTIHAPPPRKKTSPMFLCALTAILLGGCSSNTAFPWQDNFLDPGRVATREPLEIPPDLDVLPPLQGEQAKKQPPTQQPQAPARLPWQAMPNPATDILNPGGRMTTTIGSTHSQPAPVADKQGTAGGLSRTEQEQLPAWMKK